MKGLVSFGNAAIAKKWHLNAAELAGAYAIFHGIYGVSPAAAWIILGLATVGFVEVRG